nr:helix-turn-helix domain-containing protein [Blastococcus sp. TBT05-19]
MAGGQGRGREARRLYEEEGRSLRQVAARMGVSHSTVRRLLLEQGVSMRRPRLWAVPDAPPAALQVAPERASIAFTADRGWHLVQAPPGWFLDLLAELD